MEPESYSIFKYSGDPTGVLIMQFLWFANYLNDNSIIIAMQL